MALKKTNAKVRMSDLTGDEGRELFPTNPVILLPMGSLEDQGPHAPMGDYMSAERIAELIAEKASAEGTRTVVAPVLPFGGADFFASVPGGIAMSQPTLKAIIADMVACLVRHNLTRLIVINGHGGNVDAVQQVALDLERSRGVVMPSLYLWRMCNSILVDILGKEKAAKATGHGADPLTSVAIHLFPHTIRADMIPDRPLPPREAFGLPVSGFPTVAFEGTDIHLPLQIDRIAPNAVWLGDPRLCSKETGEAVVRRLTDIGAAFIHHFVRHSAL